MSNVHYKMALALIKGGDNFFGHVVATFDLSETSPKIFIDYKGRAIHSLRVNGVQVTEAGAFNKQRIFLPVECQKEGANLVEILFESEYVSDCQEVQHFKDEQDGQEYIYSDLEPANCRNWFPCFDQPDLKATQKFVCFVPADWVIASNTSEESNSKVLSAEQAELFKLDAPAQAKMVEAFAGAEHYIVEFGTSKPMSTYIYNVTAGPFAIFHPK